MSDPGPLRSSVSHFLRMLIEYRLATIVMLTRCIEDGKVGVVRKVFELKEVGWLATPHL